MAKKKKEKVLTAEQIAAKERKAKFDAIKLDDIIAYCQENKQVKWLKELTAEKVPEWQKNDKGEHLLDDDGKKVPVLDEEGNQVMRDKTFIEIKIAFVDKFMPDVAPLRKPKKTTLPMIDRIAALEEEE